MQWQMLQLIKRSRRVLLCYPNTASSAVKHPNVFMQAVKSAFIT